MNPIHFTPNLLRSPIAKTLGLGLAAMFLFAGAGEAATWWNAKWPVRKKITIDTTEAGFPIKDPVGSPSVLVRLHDGNFQFPAAKEDGTDMRFVAEDDKTLLSYHIERYDSLLNEAFVWVKVPEVKPGTKTSFWFYYGNTEDAARVDDAKATYDGDTVLVYHFAENGAAPVDSSASGIKAENAGVPVGGALIGGGISLTGQSGITIPAADPLKWPANGGLSWSAWVKPSALQADAVLFSRHDGASGFVIGINNGVPYVEVSAGGKAQRSTAGTPIAVNAWRHLALVADGGGMTLYLEGQPYASLKTGLPALQGPAVIGKDAVNATGFSGEVDELQISKTPRAAGWIRFAAVNEGTSPDAAKLVAVSEDEGGKSGGGLAEHFSLFAQISKSLTFDGWIVIALCSLLAIVGWGISISKFLYLNRIGKASKLFLQQWKTVSNDITVLDHADEKSVHSFGGNSSNADQWLVRQSPLFHLYHLGSQEIQKRIDGANGNFKGLSGRSIQAIRAILDGGQMMEVQQLQGKLVFLTIGIAGGPYLGLLGTVIGVMITFAVIAQSGEVEINSIAPGIAGALLATVAGLAVAIPALFAYSYLSSRIKEAVNGMQSFINEFVARIAEAYPTPNE